MIHSRRFTCVLDTNVLHPVTIRNLIFWLAHYDLFTIQWSKHIFDEWIGVMKRFEIDDKTINSRIAAAERAFPFAMVENYEPLIEGLSLPDEKDRHVLAAAIKTNANVIVTNNLKHFPSDYLSTFGLCAKSPDDFICDTIDLNNEIAIKAFRKMVLNYTDPNFNELEVLDFLRNNGLKNSANYLHSMI